MATDSLFGTLFGSGYQDAANATKTGLTTGYNQATPLFQQGREALTAGYTSALDPYNKILQQTAPGVNAYGTALGLGGDPAAVQKQLEATPGYQFNLDQGLQAIDRSAASRGLTTSGNTLAAEQKYGAGLASQTYNDYVTNLARFLPQELAAAGGAANAYTGGANAISGSLGNQAILGYNTQAGIGNAQASADVAQQNAQNSFLGGVANLGTKLLGNVNYNPSSGFSYGSQGGGGQTYQTNPANPFT
jgi:hypothetical protein